jgi:hypothetical protein
MTAPCAPRHCGKSRWAPRADAFVARWCQVMLGFVNKVEDGSPRLQSHHFPSKVGGLPARAPLLAPAPRHTPGMVTLPALPRRRGLSRLIFPPPSYCVAGIAASS